MEEQNFAKKHRRQAKSSYLFRNPASNYLKNNNLNGVRFLNLSESPYPK